MYIQTFQRPDNTYLLLSLSIEHLPETSVILFKTDDNNIIINETFFQDNCCYINSNTPVFLDINDVDFLKKALKETKTAFIYLIEKKFKAIEYKGKFFVHSDFIKTKVRKNKYLAFFPQDENPYFKLYSNKTHILVMIKPDTLPNLQPPTLIKGERDRNIITINNTEEIEASVYNDFEILLSEDDIEILKLCYSLTKDHIIIERRNNKILFHLPQKLYIIPEEDFYYYFPRFITERTL